MKWFPGIRAVSTLRHIARAMDESNRIAHARLKAEHPELYLNDTLTGYRTRILTDVGELNLHELKKREDERKPLEAEDWD